MLRLRVFSKVIILFLFANKLEAFPSNNFDSDLISAENHQLNDDEVAFPSNMDQKIQETVIATKLIPLPHVLCTGFSIEGLLEKCFPVGCICGKGAGICNLANKCIRKTSFFNITFNKDLTEGESGQE